MNISEYNDFDPDRQIAIIWSVEDVQSLVDVTDDEAMNVLDHVKDNHDCTLGVTWDNLEFWLENLYPDAKLKDEDEDD